MVVPYEITVVIRHPNTYYSAEEIQELLNEKFHLDKFKVEEVGEDQCTN